MVSWMEKIRDAQVQLAARSIDPWRAPLERVRGKIDFDGLERLSSQKLLDILEVPQRGRTAGTCRRLAKLMAELGWHLQLWIDAKDLPETIPVLKSLGLPVVIDHMGRTDARAGIGTEGFQSLLRAVGDGWCWAKLSGAHRLSRDAPDYHDARPFHEALVRVNPERLVWGGDWPHPRLEGEMPDAGHLFELFQLWTPDRAIQHRILVTNPAKLYGFPN